MTVALFIAGIIMCAFSLLSTVGMERGVKWPEAMIYISISIIGATLMVIAAALP
jgi:hypothetical protein